jgi:hypothetical protein
MKNLGHVNFCTLETERAKFEAQPSATTLTGKCMPGLFNALVSTKTFWNATHTHECFSRLSTSKPMMISNSKKCAEMGPSALAISPRPYGILTNSNWGVVQLVGHLTVNEDGEGSNPSAPAKISTVENGQD